MPTASGKKPAKTIIRASNPQASDVRAADPQPQGVPGKVAESKSSASAGGRPKKLVAPKDAPVKSARAKSNASQGTSATRGAGAAVPEKIFSTSANPGRKTRAGGTEKSTDTAEAPSSRAGKDEEALGQMSQSRQVKKVKKSSGGVKPGKIKVLRDSYSIPEDEHKEIAALKKRCGKHGHQVKKSYLLRAGLQALAQMDDKELLAAVERVR